MVDHAYNSKMIHDIIKKHYHYFDESYNVTIIDAYYHTEEDVVIIFEKNKSSFDTKNLSGELSPHL